jgi:hypothetical protein
VTIVMSNTHCRAHRKRLNKPNISTNTPMVGRLKMRRFHTKEAGGSEKLIPAYEEAEYLCLRARKWLPRKGICARRVAGEREQVDQQVIRGRYSGEEGILSKK